MNRKTLVEVNAEIDAQIAVGELSRYRDFPLEYVGLVVGTIAGDRKIDEKLQPAPGVVRVEGTDELIEGDA